MYISQLVQRVEADAASQAARIAHARTLEEVVRFADISIPSQIRFMRNSIRGLRSLETTAERRIEEMIKVRLDKIAAANSAVEAKAERGRFIQECSRLRGTYSRQYGHADRESQRLVYLKEQSEKRAEEGANIPSSD
jgi:hypothetical protein